MRISVSAVLVVASLALPSVAYAGPAGDSDENARVGGGGGKATVYDFEDDNVDGELLSPDGDGVQSRVRSKHANMITIRPHFITELIKMANDI